ncbi:MAG: hypothetical protein O3A00_05500 [Planctomycetota bacterium]|nr:hypothetical protein [Planctomycetota bacterium]
MQAVLSGQAAVALLNDGDAWLSIHYDDPELLVPRAPEDFAVLFDDAHDLEWLNETSVDDVRDKLEDAVDSSEALNLVLYLFDGEFSDATRDAAALEVEELLSDPWIVGQVENVFLSTPLPQTADANGAKAACVRTGCEVAERLVRSWIASQPNVQQVWAAWCAIDASEFHQAVGGDPDLGDARSVVQGLFVRHGIFRKLVQDGSAAVQFAVQKDSELNQRLSGLTALLNSLTTSIRLQRLSSEASKVESLPEAERHHAASSGKRESFGQSLPRISVTRVATQKVGVKKKAGTDKCAAIRKYLSTNPEAKPMEIIAELRKKGLVIPLGLVIKVRHEASPNSRIPFGKPLKNAARGNSKKIARRSAQNAARRSAKKAARRREKKAASNSEPQK